MTDEEYIKNISSVSTEKLFNLLEYYGYDSYYNELCEATIEELKKRIEERPHGEWKTVEGFDGDEYYECSNCGEPWVLEAGTPKDNNMNFCPNCGADMRKEEEDG